MSYSLFEMYGDHLVLHVLTHSCPTPRSSVRGAVPIVAGLDKFMNILTDWGQYLSPWVSSVIPATTFMPLVGVIEIAAGILVLSKLTRIGAYVVALWRSEEHTSELQSLLRISYAVFCLTKKAEQFFRHS